MLGNWDYERTVVIKFPSFKLAKDFHNSSEYEPVKKIREEKRLQAQKKREEKQKKEEENPTPLSSSAKRDVLCA